MKTKRTPKPPRPICRMFAGSRKLAAFRLPIETFQSIQAGARKMGISQSDYIALLLIHAHR